MILTEKFEVHDELNPKIWNTDSTLRDDVKVKVIEIVNQFLSTLESVPLDVIDIRIVGSNASYNYTEHSDLDVHIVTNFELYDASPEILQLLYNALKAKFNADYSITVRGIDVELYVEDVRSTAISNGVYSVLKSSWIKYPQKIDHIPEIDVSKEVQYWKDKIESITSVGTSSDIVDAINDIYLIRKDSLSSEGEYGHGNQLFKELRNNQFIDMLKNAYKKSRSKELSLESLQQKRLTEASRTNLLTKSKHSEKGLQRFKRRVKSRIANSVKQYNRIDMNKLFKDDILTVEVEVKGETDTYYVKISYGGFLELLHDQLRIQQDKLDLKAITRALVNGFNRDDVYIHCSCPDWKYRYAYFATRNDINSGDPETRASNITNPEDKLGSACKHVLLVLSNTSWILKVGATIFNYINYMEKHYQRLYADVLYPAIYQREYEEPVQLDMMDDGDNLQTDSDTIDKSNETARTKGQFKQGNTQGVRFAPNQDENQISFDSADES